MNRFIFALTIIICCSSFLFGQTERIAYGKLKGSVYSLDRESVVPFMEITVDGRGIKKTFNLNLENLEYEFNLPAGVYSITLKEGIFYDVKRASFRVEAGKTIIVNLYPARRINSVSLTLDGDEYQYNSAPKEDSLIIDGPASEIIVEFSEKTSDTESIQYKNAKLTFENQTLLADFIRFDKKSKLFELEGNVLIDDNGQRTTAKQASVKLEGGRLKKN